MWSSSARWRLVLSFEYSTLTQHKTSIKASIRRVIKGYKSFQHLEWNCSKSLLGWWRKWLWECELHNKDLKRKSGSRLERFWDTSLEGSINQYHNNTYVFTLQTNIMSLICSHKKNNWPIREMSLITFIFHMQSHTLRVHRKMVANSTSRCIKLKAKTCPQEDQM